VAFEAATATQELLKAWRSGIGEGVRKGELEEHDGNRKSSNGPVIRRRSSHVLAYVEQTKSAQEDIVYM